MLYYSIIIYCNIIWHTTKGSNDAPKRTTQWCSLRPDLQTSVAQDDILVSHRAWTSLNKQTSMNATASHFRASSNPNGSNFRQRDRPHSARLRALEVPVAEGLARAALAGLERRCFRVIAYARVSSYLPGCPLSCLLRSLGPVVVLPLRAVALHLTCYSMSWLILITTACCRLSYLSSSSDPTSCGGAVKSRWYGQSPY